MLPDLFAERCPRCLGPSQRGYCAGCRRDYPRIEQACPSCGLARPVMSCPRRERDWHIDTVLAPFEYTAAIKRQIQKLKFQNARKLGRALGLLLLEEIVSMEVDALVAVPLHRQRLRQRGYNQAYEIARPVAARLAVPLLIRGIVRRRPTESQALLPAARRARNLVGAFRVTRPLDGRRIAIIDDVLTTGATVNALGEALLHAGAAAVHAWSVARAL